MFGTKQTKHVRGGDDVASKIRSLKRSQKYALSLDYSKIRDITLVLDAEIGGQKSEISHTILEWIERFKSEGLKPDTSQLNILKDWCTSKGKYTEGISNSNSSLASGLLNICIDLMQKDPKYHLLNTQWYFLRQDCVIDDPHYSWHFFVGKNDEVVLESARLFGGYSEEDTIWDLFHNPIENPTWMDENRYAQAATIWMYRKFYRETQMGQIEAIFEELGRADFSEQV